MTAGRAFSKPWLLKLQHTASQVCIERCDAQGSLLHRQKAKGVTVELGSAGGRPCLVISMLPTTVCAGTAPAV